MKRRKLRGKKLLVVGAVALASLTGCDDGPAEETDDDSAEVDEATGPGSVGEDDEIMAPVGNLIPAPDFEDEVPLEEPPAPEEPPAEG